MKKLMGATAILSLLLMTSGCTTTQVVPVIPSQLLIPCQPLTKLDEGSRWSDVLTAHAADIKIHDECAAKVEAIKTYVGK